MSTPLNQSAFARLAGCKRQNVWASIQNGTLKKDDNGLLDPEHPDNKFWLETRHVTESVPSTKRGPKKKEVVQEIPPPKKEPKKKVEKIVTPEITRDEHIGSARDENKKHGNKKDSQNKKDPQDHDDEHKNEPMQAQKIRLEVEKLREQRDKLKIENQKARAELVDRELLADALFGYLIALNKKMMDLPLSYVDEFESAMKLGKSKTELTDILRKPISEVIIDCRDQIKKEIESYKRMAKHEIIKSNEDE